MKAKTSRFSFLNVILIIQGDNVIDDKKSEQNKDESNTSSNTDNEQTNQLENVEKLDESVSSVIRQLEDIHVAVENESGTSTTQETG